MLKNKRGISMISLVLCALVVATITTALVLAKRNQEEYIKASRVESVRSIEETQAYVKIYTRSEVANIAKKAYVNNSCSCCMCIDTYG